MVIYHFTQIMSGRTCDFLVHDNLQQCTVEISALLYVTLTFHKQNMIAGQSSCDTGLLINAGLHIPQGEPGHHSS